MTTYTTTSGPWFHVTNGQIDQQSWGVPVPLQQSDISVIMAAGWFPGLESGKLPAIPGTAAGSTTAYDPNYSYQPVTITLAGQQVNVVYGAPVSVSLAQAQATALSTLAVKRYEAQSGGTTVNGVSVKTDAESLTLIAGAKAYVDAGVASGNSGISVNFKTGEGAFVTLTAAQVDAIAFAVGQHVQGCFSNEAAIAAQIAAATSVDEVAGLNINTGWPS